MIFGTYAQAVANGQITSFAFPARARQPALSAAAYEAEGSHRARAVAPVGADPRVCPSPLAPPPAIPGRVYAVQVKAKAEPLGYVEVTAGRLLMPWELTATDTAQFPNLAALRAFAAGRPIYLLTLHPVGASIARRRLLEQRNSPA